MPTAQWKVGAPNVTTTGFEVRTPEKPHGWVLSRNQRVVPAANGLREAVPEV